MFSWLCDKRKPPKKGSFTAWKLTESNNGSPILIELEIPAEAKRLCPGYSNRKRKCRASEAKVIAMYNKDGTKLADHFVAFSGWDCNFKYKVGTTVKPRYSFEESRSAVCASGIHFFMLRKDAERYDFS